MLIESITLAQRDNKELEALIYRFRPLIRKCGRQLHIEDGEQEMVVAFIELIKRFRPERLRSQDDGKVVQYIKNAMNYSCFKIYKKHHNPIATIISLEEITVKEEAAYLTGSDQSQDMQLDQTFQLDLLTEKERIVIFLIHIRKDEQQRMLTVWREPEKDADEIRDCFPIGEPLLKKVDWDAGGGASQQVISRDMEIVCNHFQFVQIRKMSTVFVIGYCTR